MKNKYSLLRLPTVALLVICIASSVSCMTTYDAYGRPLQTVDPGLAVAGIAAAGLIGYAASNNNGHHHGGGHDGGYYGGGYYGGGDYGPCY